MAIIEITFNDVCATYAVNATVEEVYKKLYYVQMKNQDFMEFDNAIRKGGHLIKKLIISPSNCAIIDIREDD